MHHHTKFQRNQTIFGWDIDDSTHFSRGGRYCSDSFSMRSGPSYNKFVQGIVSVLPVCFRFFYVLPFRKQIASNAARSKIENRCQISYIWSLHKLHKLREGYAKCMSQLYKVWLTIQPLLGYTLYRHCSYVWKITVWVSKRTETKRKAINTHRAA